MGYRFLSATFADWPGILAVAVWLVTGMISAQVRTGPEIFADDFRSQRNWTEGDNGPCRSSYGNEGLAVTNIAQSGNCRFNLERVGSLPASVRIEATMSLRAGSPVSGFGITFGRPASANDRFFYFAITGRGAYRLSVWREGAYDPLVDRSSDPAIRTGYGSVNTLAVEVRGSELRYFINDRLLGTTIAPVAADGSIGFFLNEPGLDVLFSRLRVLRIAESSAPPAFEVPPAVDRPPSFVVPPASDVVFEGDFRSQRMKFSMVSDACSFRYEPGGFVIANNMTAGETCSAPITDKTAWPENFRIDVTLTIRRGEPSHRAGFYFGSGDASLLPSRYTFTVCPTPLAVIAWCRAR